MVPSVPFGRNLPHDLVSRDLDVRRNVRSHI